MHRLTGGIALLGVLWISGGSLLAQERVPDSVAAARQEHINQVFGLRAGTVVTPELSQLAEGPLQVVVSFGSGDLTLRLRPHSNRAAGYVVEQIHGGQRTPGRSQPIRTLRGTVDGHPGDCVAASLGADGLSARLMLADGRRLWLEPLTPRVAADAGEHVLYDERDVVAAGGICQAAQQRAVQSRLALRSASGSAACGGGLCVAELACDADVEYFEFWGSVEAVEERINSVINAVNLQFERELQISHRITTLIVRLSEPDPYDESDAEALLAQFRDHWQNNHAEVPRDLAQLFTGRNLDGNTVGIAWLGAVCGELGYAVVQSDWAKPFACATDLSAHEMGHNWGADHCACPEYTMNPWIGCVNQFHPQFTLPQIATFRDTRKCLDLPEPECGNQICDPGENSCSCAADCPGCCTSDECDDGVECTVDLCNPVHSSCVFVPQQALCDNGEICDGLEVCDPQAGCLAGDPIDCDDGLACTTDHCDELSGRCLHTPDDGTCDDGVPCNGAERCDLQEGCLPGMAIDCDDEFPCTLDICDPVSGACAHQPQDELCDDGDLCTGQETCVVDLGCQSGVPVDCDDGLPCTLDSCDLLTGGCHHVPDDAFCDDGLVCTGTESCDPRSGCIAVDAPLCDDGVDCTLDRCDEAVGGCVHEPEDQQCDDGSFCNGPETCDPQDGCQVAAGSPCDDGLECTLDLCDEQADRCATPVDPQNCDNGLYCDGAEQCDPAAGCIPGVPPCGEGLCDESLAACRCTDDGQCPDSGDVCRIAVCEIATGMCMVATAPDGTECDDEDPCSVDDRCSLGDCVGGDLQCSDEDPCTLDVCVDGECIHDPLMADADGDQEPDCSDGCPQDPDKTAPGACGCGVAEGTCGPPGGGGGGGAGTVDPCALLQCDDGDACTLDACVAGNCVHTAVVCDDTDACTVDTCINGTCDHQPLDCSDGDPCTLDDCMSGACTHTALDCDDGDPCTSDACVDGTCDHSAMDCADDDACTVDACGLQGCTHQVVMCDDAVPCTEDFCDVLTGGCVHDPGGCDADDDGVPDATDQCPLTVAGDAVDPQGCAASQLTAPAGQLEPDSGEPTETGEPGCGACRPQPLTAGFLLLGFLGMRRRRS